MGGVDSLALCCLNSSIWPFPEEGAKRVFYVLRKKSGKRGELLFNWKRK